MTSATDQKHYRPDPAAHAIFRSASSRFSTQGIRAALPAGPLCTLGTRVRDFLGATQGPQILLGALPFDREQPDCLFQPLAITDIVPHPPGGSLATGQHWRVAHHPGPADYARMVARALEVIANDPGLSKVVLARRLLIQTDVPLDPGSVAMRLGRDTTITAFAMPLSMTANGPARTLIGATPELLLEKKGRAIRSNPLAGSARRQADPAADKAVAAALMASDKNRREHAVVVEAILDGLAPFCTQLATPENMGLYSTASMWHLGTRIEGRLRDEETSCADLLAQIHPTPAICGFPRNAAQSLIRKLEPFDRGYYAGAVGWTDAKGDGEWHIALRCGEICDRQITLYAGAGIVAGSSPAAEIEETSAKFLALLHALGIDEDGHPLGEAVA